INTYRQRIDMGVFLPAIGEKIAERYFYRRMLLPIPENPQDQAAPFACIGGHPDMLNDARAFDLGQGELLTRLDVKGRRNLPPLAEPPRGLGTQPIYCPAATALFARHILRRYRATDGARG